jgi:gluconate 5-dehydrogenase
VTTPPGSIHLAGKRILITGSSSGLGYELAKGLARAGAKIVVNGRRPERVAAAVERLKQESAGVSSVCFDVTIEEDVRRGVAEAGLIHVLVNNAGIQRRGSLEQFTLAGWNEVLNANLTSCFLVAREAVRGMIERRSGKIINICSVMSDFGRATTGPYTASKGGLKMLTKAMCADWARYNIQINGIAPGYFITEMTQKLADNPEFDAWVKRRTPAERWGEPAELVGAAVFLSSDSSSFVNGQVLYVDGGMSSVL